MVRNACSRVRLSVEDLEARHCLSGSYLVAHEIALRTTDSVFSADLDGDGDMDLLSASQSPHRITWYEQRLAVPGDADRNGVFDRCDITQILQAGKFLTGETATWEEGDWNGDSYFDQVDIVMALAEGHYTTDGSSCSGGGGGGGTGGGGGGGTIWIPGRVIWIFG